MADPKALEAARRIVENCDKTGPYVPLGDLIDDGVTVARAYLAARAEADMPDRLKPCDVEFVAAAMWEDENPNHLWASQPPKFNGRETFLRRARVAIAAWNRRADDPLHSGDGSAAGATYEAPRDPSHKIRVRGVGRDAAEPRSLSLALTERPTDDELRALHDFFSQRPMLDALSTTDARVREALEKAATQFDFLAQKMAGHRLLAEGLRNAADDCRAALSEGDAGRTKP